MSSFNNQGNVGHQIGTQNVHGSIYITNNLQSSEPSMGSTTVTSEQEALKSLTFTRMFDRQRRIEQPSSGTCQWIFQTPQYQSWASQGCGILWIKGHPGSGKSTMMSVLYHHFSANMAIAQTVVLRVFLNARGQELEKTPIGLLRSLLSQLIVSDADVRKAIGSIYQEKKAFQGETRQEIEWHTAELKQLLSEAFDKVLKTRSLIVFVDALDEAGESAAREIAHYFRKLSQSLLAGGAKAAFCFSCRHYPVITIANCSELVMEQHNKLDIHCFTSATLEQALGSTQDLTIADGQKLVSQIVNRAAGICQWAHLICDMVCKQVLDGDSFETIYNWLLSVPTELSNTYEYVIQHVIDSKHRLSSLRLFQWVCFAQRPLTLPELRDALNIQKCSTKPATGQSQSTLASIQTDEQMRLKSRSLSGGLIEVVSRSKTHDQDLEHFYNLIPGSKDMVQVIHQSVNDYICGNGLRLLFSLAADHNASFFNFSGLDWTFERLVSHSHQEIFESCLHYMLTDDFTDWARRAKEGEKEIYSRSPLISYAAIHLFRHASNTLHLEAQDFQQYQDNLERVVASVRKSIRDVTRPRDWLFRNGRSLLHEAVAHNMQPMAKCLLANGHDITARDHRKRSAIQIAVEKGHIEMVKLLHNAGADLMDEPSLLYIACSYSRYSVLRWLLAHPHDPYHENGKERELQNRRFWARASCAAKGCAGNLLDIEASSDRDETALQRSCYTEDDNALKLLLLAGADPNYVRGPESDRATRRPLWHAIQYSHPSKVKLLLAAGADVNVLGGDDTLSLLDMSIQIYHLACEHEFTWNISEPANQSVDTITYHQLLREASEETNEVYNYDATVRNSKEIVKYLLRAGADVKACDSRTRGSPLQYAAHLGLCDITSTLLDGGADVNAIGGPRGTALQAASAEGNVETMKILLAAGADANTRGANFPHALNVAVCNAHTKAVKILIDAKVDVNARLDPETQLADTYENEEQDLGSLHFLAWTSRSDYESFRRASKFSTALQIACGIGHEEIVKMLLDAGADVDAPAGKMGTALEAAQSIDCTNVVELLRTKGKIQEIERQSVSNDAELEIVDE